MRSAAFPGVQQGAPFRRRGAVRLAAIRRRSSAPTSIQAVEDVGQSIQTGAPVMTRSRPRTAVVAE
jgi:hypothetical protein